MASFTKLPNGEWGVSGEADEIVAGRTVTVVTRDGRRSKVRVGGVVREPNRPEGRWVKGWIDDGKSAYANAKPASKPAPPPPKPAPPPPKPAPPAPQASRTPEQVLALIEGIAPPNMQAWIGARRGLLLQVVAKVLAEHTAPAPAEPAPPVVTAKHAATVPASERMDLASAVEWLQRAATILSASTRYDERTGAMLQDEVGASYATHAALVNYSGVPLSAPIETHLAGLEAVRVHSHTQLDRDDFERAAAAVRAEAAQQGIDPDTLEGLPRVYPAQASVKSGLQDGAHYRWERNQLAVRLPRRRDGPSANDLLRAAGVPREAFTWFAGPGEAYKSWIAVRPEWIDAVGAALAAEYPELAAAIRQNANAWRQDAGVAVTAVLKDDDEAPAPRPAGPKGFPWEWDAKNYRLLLDFSPYRAKQIAQDFNVGFTSVDGVWKVYVVRDLLPSFVAKLEAVKNEQDPRWRLTAESIAPHVAGWLAEVGALRQTKASGQESGGGWEQVGDGAPVDIAVAYLPRPIWDQLRRKFTATVTPDGRKVWRVPEKRVPQFADILAQHEPLQRLAEALNRTFGGVAKVLDAAERERAKVLAEFNAATTPAQVTSPEGRRRLAQVEEAFHRYGPHGLLPLDFQWIGAAAALEADFRYGIFDSPGLGKTVQALLAMLVFKHVTGTDPWPALVVAPANVVFNWQAEARKWLSRVLPEQSIRALDSSKDAPGPQDAVVIISWDYLATNVDKLAAHGFQFGVFDEAHYAKNFAAKRSKAFQEIAKVVPAVITLTGTPIKNVISELFPLLTAMHPDDWGNFKEFRRKFSVVEEKNVSGRTIEKDTGGVNVENLPELRARLDSSRIRRTKTQVLLDLPPKTRRTVEVPVGPMQMQEYRAAEEQFEDWLRAKVVQEMLRLRAERGLSADLHSMNPRELGALQVAAAEQLARAMRNEVLVQMGKLRVLTGRFKAPAAVEIALDLARRNEPVLLWADHRAVVDTMARALAQAGVAYAVIDGGTSKKTRTEITQDFQNGLLNVIVATKAAKEGLTLTRASHAVFVERYWTPADEQQAEDRIHRISQTRPVEIIRLEVPGTIDRYMAEVNSRKADLVDAVLGDEDVEASFEAGIIADALAMYTSKLGQGLIENPRRRATRRRHA